VKGTYTLSGIPYRLPENTEYIAVDFWDWHTFRSHFYNEGSPERLRQLFIDGGFKAVSLTQTAALFKKGAEKKYELYRILKDAPALPEGPSIDINNDIQLIGYDIDKALADKGVILFQFYWKCLKKTDKVYGAFLDILDKDGHFVKQAPRFLCYRVYPTNEWQTGEIIEEFYRLLLPAELIGQRYDIRMGICDFGTMAAPSVGSAAKDAVDIQMRVKLK
jgi:hypothetical protein